MRRVVEGGRCIVFDSTCRVVVIVSSGSMTIYLTSRERRIEGQLTREKGQEGTDGNSTCDVYVMDYGEALERFE
jgi:hypothetical protein